MKRLALHKFIIGFIAISALIGIITSNGFSQTTERKFAAKDEFAAYHTDVSDKPTDFFCLDVFRTEVTDANADQYLLTVDAQNRVINVSFYKEGKLTPFTSYIPFRDQENLELNENRYAKASIEQVTYMRYVYEKDTIRKELRDASDALKVYFEYKYESSEDGTNPYFRLTRVAAYGKTRFQDKMEMKNYIAYHYGEDGILKGYSFFNQEKQPIFRVVFNATDTLPEGITGNSIQKYVKFKPGVSLAGEDYEEKDVQFYFLFVKENNMIAWEIKYSPGGYRQAIYDHREVKK